MQKHTHEKPAIITKPAFLTEEITTVLNSVYNGVMIVNSEGRIALINHAAASLIGFSSEKIIGRPVDDVIPNTGLLRVLKTGIAEINQHMNMGQEIILTNRSPIYKKNEIIGAVAIFQDITELTAVITELEDVKKLKSTLESILEALEEGIVVINKQGIITKMNRAYGNFLGLDPQKVVGKPIVDVIQNTRMHLVAQSGNAEFAEFQQINNHVCVVTRIPILKDGEIIGAVGNVIFQDVKDVRVLASKVNKLQSELEFYKEEFSKVNVGKYTFENIIGNNEKMVWLKKIALKAAKGTSTVLILGESGTGKELFAHSIHNASTRQQGPLIKVNCGALPETLLEAELFGYEEGAFTGARKGGKPGKFELANGGTILLDEIGELPIAMQVKLLRVLQERELERVGGTTTIKLNIRVIAATSRDLEKMIEQNQFRQDLYYRLNVFTLNIPPLRERLDDIPALCEILLKKINRQVEHWVEEISPAALDLLMKYCWPGNIRELENVLERTINLMDDETVIHPEHLPPILKKAHGVLTTEDNSAAFDLEIIINKAEQQAIKRALDASGGNKTKAAKILGVHRSAFYQKMRKYNMVDIDTPPHLL
ncbi:PAS domain S-box-containing protein [Sporomusaceae bacterium BoRhaA]|uniref:sigma-54 interaction domain-containing protein n=1 Tax=Pelorhabdus rhamnosifermentans TaxID=2772457 RepID=UPI001FE904EE|nr:sigma-54-dependent Fis family transcriptional regulator [Pelorhabdus rhamnosifermentans]MBU2700497.1 PAS domain S-box-containing protein [Pelorhabdus rhamnosifermentans]